MERYHYRYLPTEGGRIRTASVSDDDIWRLWQRKLDTAAIASTLHIAECEAANRLMHIRERKRLEKLSSVEA